MYTIHKYRMRRIVATSLASAEVKIIETGLGNTNEPRIEQEQYDPFYASPCRSARKRVVIAPKRNKPTHVID